MSADRLLVALDVDNGTRALEIASALGDIGCGFKVGSRLFTLEGPDLVRKLTALKTRVFLDLKFHDIPNTVAQAVDSAVQTGAWMINVHASGGVPMMRAAAEAGRRAAERLKRPPPVLIAVTVLTSMDDQVLRDTGVQRPLADHVAALARMAQDAGLDGVVASAHETAAIRRACGDAFVIVTPGIRGAAAGTETNDQARTMGPAEAITAGAHYIVVGRPIIAAPNVREAAARIVEEMTKVEK